MPGPTSNLDARADQLVELAKQRFGEENVTPTLEKLCRAAANGGIASYSSPSADENDPVNADRWGAGRVLEAEHIAWLCTDSEASGLVTHQGIQVAGARIDGGLGLDFAHVTFPLMFGACAFTEEIKLRHATLPTLYMASTHIKSISADGMNVTGNVFLSSGFKATGEVRLLGATIGGDLDCAGGGFTNEGGDALRADGMKVRGEVSLSKGFTATGEVGLIGATIGGSLNCSGGEFMDGRGHALSADGMDVKGSVFLTEGFKATGQVSLVGATIGGDLGCDGGEFMNEGGQALSADGTNVTGSVFFRAGFKATGEVRLLGAAIGGTLGCNGGEFTNEGGKAFSADGLSVKGSVSLNSGLKAAGEVCLLNATIGGHLICSGGLFTNKGGNTLNADSMSVTGSVFLNNGIKAKGEMCLKGARIGGNLECAGGEFTNAGGVALAADGLNVTGSVFLCDGFKATGEMRLTGATIGANLQCNSGEFMNKRGHALNADRLNVKGDVFLNRGFKATGEVRLLGATIGGTLDCTGGEFMNEGGYALGADGMNVTGNVFLRDGFKAEGRVDLVGAIVGLTFQWYGHTSVEKPILDLRLAQLGGLMVHSKSWPEKGNLWLHGLRHGLFEDTSPDEGSPSDPKGWLRRQADKPFRSQPYQQLAAVLRTQGRNSDAAEVLYAMEEDRGRFAKMSQLQRLVWYWLFGWVIGYGYKLWRAAILSVILIALGSVLFNYGAWEKVALMTSVGAPSAGTPGQTLNPVMYSLDVFVPLVDLRQVKYWLPSPGWLRGWFWLQIIAGWTLTTLLVVGMTKIVRQ